MIIQKTNICTNQPYTTLERRMANFGPRCIDLKLEESVFFKSMDALDKTAVQYWAKDPKGYLTILGCIGSGKSSMCSALTENFPEDVKYIRGKNKWFLEEYYVYSPEFIKKSVVILDDISDCRLSITEMDCFSKIIDERYSEMLPTIFISHVDRDELAVKIGIKNYSRVNSGLVIRDKGKFNYHGKTAPRIVTKKQIEF